MILADKITETNRKLAALHAERETLILGEFKANPYTTISGMARKYKCSKCVVSKIRREYEATLPRVAAMKVNAKGWGF